MRKIYRSVYPGALLLPGFFYLGKERSFKMRRSGSEVVARLSTVSLLAALGFILMAFARIPYPPAPWLMIEVSELCVLIAYAMYGFTGGLSVAVLKTVLDLLVHGLTDPLGVGHITALLTSILFVFFLFLTSHVLKWFKKGIGFRILAYVVITLSIALILTLLNALFITPSYLTAYGDNPHFSTCFGEGVMQNVIEFFHQQNSYVDVSSYFLLISVIYLPFNLLKGVLCCVIYELIFNRLIFVLMSRSPMMKKYFLGSIFKKKEVEPIEEKETVEINEEQNQEIDR